MSSRSQLFRLPYTIRHLFLASYKKIIYNNRVNGAVLISTSLTSTTAQPLISVTYQILGSAHSLNIVSHLPVVQATLDYGPLSRIEKAIALRGDGIEKTVYILSSAAKCSIPLQSKRGRRSSEREGSGFASVHHMKHVRMSRIPHKKSCRPSHLMVANVRDGNDVKK